MQVVREMPEKGDASTLMQRLKHYIDPVDEEWFYKLKPASKESIDKLKTILGMEEIGWEFPRAFKEYARHAGEGDGGLILSSIGGNLSISSLIVEHEPIYIKNKEWVHPEWFNFLQDDLLYIYSMNIVDGVDQGIYFFGDMAEEQEERLAEELGIDIAGLDIKDTAEKLYSSFEDLVFQCAVKKYERRYFHFTFGFGTTKDSFSNSYVVQNKIDVIELIEDIFRKYNLERAWFSDSVFHFAYSKNISFSIGTRGIEKKLDGLGGVLYCNDRGIVEALKEDFFLKIGSHVYEKPEK